MTAFPASEREPGSIDSHLHKPEIHEDIQTFKTSLFTFFFYRQSDVDDQTGFFFLLTQIRDKHK